MAIQIQFRRGTATEWSASNPILAQGEMGIETDTDKFKIGNGIDRWNIRPYGGIAGVAGPAGPTIAVQNVLYVSKSGNDSNNGTTLGASKLTIRAALAIATRGTTIFVKSGDYTEINPTVVPAYVSIIGDNLRSVTIRPNDVNQDIFYVNNGVYIANVTFKDHEAPSAAVAFNPDGSAGFIKISPYVQNCSSLTSTGAGMRVDGSYAEGTKSMVVDAFTQYNQGGIGIHMLNGGYTQLVSVFTICCDKAILCESGGSCSVTNSNSSFGNYALYADGVGSEEYDGVLSTTSTIGPAAVFTVTNLITRPVVGQGVTFDGGINYYTVASSTVFKIGNVSIATPLLDFENANLLNARSNILSRKSTIQVQTINYLSVTFPTFVYDQYKCNRDIATILDSVTYDMVLGSNQQSRTAGIAYTRGSSDLVTGSQSTQTVAAINFVKSKALSYISTGTTASTRLSAAFDTIINIFNSGTSVAPALTLPSPTNPDTNRVAAKNILQANKSFFQAEVLAYITKNFSGFSSEKCYRDLGYIVDAISYDMAFGSNFKSIKAGSAYYRGNASSANVIENELSVTVQSFNYLKTLMTNLVSDNADAVYRINTNMATIVNILNSGTSVAPSYSLPAPLDYDVGFQRARDLIFTNTNFIKAEAIQYITNNYPTLVYNTSTYQTDIVYIVDSLRYDLTYGGNTEALSAGNAYWVGTTRQITTATLTATINSFNFIKGLVASISTNSSVTALQTATTQVSGTAGSLTATNTATSLIDSIIAIINTQSSAPSVVYPSVSWVANNTQTSFTSIQNSSTVIRSNTINWARTTLGVFSYDTSTCYRDTGYVIDAVCYDMALGSNFKAIKAGQAYYRANTSSGIVISTELTATIAAFSYLKDLMLEVVTTSTDVAGITNLRHSFYALNAILSGGINATPAIIITNPSNLDSGYSRAIALITTNTNFIKAEAIQYITNNYPTLVYNTATCQRDIGYIIDAVKYDLTYGGNSEAVTSGRSYWVGTTSQVGETETTATSAVYGFISTIIGQVVLSTVITPLQGSVVQYRGTAGSAGAATTASYLVATIQSYITTATPAVSVIYPSLTWTPAVRQANFNVLQSIKPNLQMSVIDWIDRNFIDFTYDEELCSRDISYIIDAFSYDVLYRGNSQSAVAAEAYFVGAVSVIPTETVQTIAAYRYLKTLVGYSVTNEYISPLQNSVTQITNLGVASNTEATIVQGLADIIINILSNQYDSTITLDERLAEPIPAGAECSFHKFSLIQTSGHTFEYVGAGTNIDSSLPQLGGLANPDNYAIQLNGGKVFFTGTDQSGDFRVGTDFTIRQATGTIDGRVFTKSLFAVMTPYILAIGQ